MAKLKHSKLGPLAPSSEEERYYANQSLTVTYIRKRHILVFETILLKKKKEYFEVLIFK